MKFIIGLMFVTVLLSCTKQSSHTTPGLDPNLSYISYKPAKADKQLSRAAYYHQLQGFWLGECIANWTGLVTEMDKIGNIGEIKTGEFYTRADWGKPDEPSIWGQGIPSDLSATIDFVFRDENEIWGADDDTDIEYMYQHLLFTNKRSVLSAEQIKDGWLNHVIPDEENYLWVSNQKAFDLMKEGVLPPATGSLPLNEHYDMIDAQLTTEIFGLLAPARPDVALKMAYLPIRTTAAKDAIEIAEFYVIMHSLASASASDVNLTINEQLMWMAAEARNHLAEDGYPAKMYDFVLSKYQSGIPWEQTRDSIYQRYQVEQRDGYDLSTRNLYCNGCFAAGINFAASLVSLFYGEGDIKETIKIGCLTGWDADNPTATWGGLLGFMIGKQGIEEAFGRSFSNKFNIHRTRQNFENDGIDSFENMAQKGVFIIDRVVQEEMAGGMKPKSNSWYIPNVDIN